MVPDFLSGPSALTVYTAGAGNDSYTLASQAPGCT